MVRVCASVDPALRCTFPPAVLNIPDHSSPYPIAQLVPNLATTTVIIACPLRYEAKLIRRSLRHAFAHDRAHHFRFDVQCCGLGAAGVNNWSANADMPRGTVVIMAGTCGSLRDDIRAGQSFIVSEVRDGEGGTWSPSLRSDTSRAVVVSVNAIIAGADDRRSLGERSGAQIVDWESVAFARVANERGWNWGIARGVSDDFQTHMPANMEHWLTPAGGMRIGPMLATMLRRPRTIGELRCLHHNSTTALRNAAGMIAALLRESQKKS